MVWFSKQMERLVDGSGRRSRADALVFLLVLIWVAGIGEDAGDAALLN